MTPPSLKVELGPNPFHSFSRYFATWSEILDFSIFLGTFIPQHSQLIFRAMYSLPAEIPYISLKITRSRRKMLQFPYHWDLHLRRDKKSTHRVDERTLQPGLGRHERRGRHGKATLMASEPGPLEVEAVRADSGSVAAPRGIAAHQYFQRAPRGTSRSKRQPYTWPNLDFVTPSLTMTWKTRSPRETPPNLRSLVYPR